MHQRFHYGTVNSSIAESLPDDRNQFSWKIPCFVLLPSIIFAAFVGHIITIAYVGGSAKQYHELKVSQNSLRSNHPTQSDASKAQLQAKAHFNEYLYTPSMTSEVFYNSTEQEKTIMSSTGLDIDSVPPLPPPDGCVATILVFRHCEAGVAREHCGYMGNLRSQYIATLFGNTTEDRWPEPSYIFAMAAGERHNDVVNNWREIETVIPLSEKLNVTIDESFGYPEEKDFVKHLYKMLRSGEMCGKIAVISWKHHDIPHISHSLGCGPENGCPMTFGENDYQAVWELTYSYHNEKYAPYVVEDTTPHGMKKRHPYGLYPQWFVYGSVQNEGFDYLQFTKSNGSF